MSRSTQPEQKTTVLKVRHSAKCRMHDPKRQWCYVGDNKGRKGIVWRDRNGGKRSRNYIWLVLICLDTRCPAELLVSENALVEWATSSGDPA